MVFQLPSMVDPTSGFEGGLRFANQMLASGLPFTAVLAFDDLTALGVVRGLTCAGLRIPEDCSVIGFDEVLPAQVSTPTITTIRQPMKEMGLLAAEWVLDALQARDPGGKERAKFFKAPPELVVRMSSAPPPQMQSKKMKALEAHI
jgi:DNA-binding LacI/PurR family transcriptional regulator